jgi:hypothetical protein
MPFSRFESSGAKHMAENRKFRPAALTGPLGEPLTFAAMPVRERPDPCHSRKSERQHVLIRARCRRGRGLTDPISIVDLTAEGCSISYPVSTLKVGQSVTIKPSAMDGIEGFVRWVSTEGAGIEFSRALYAPVAEHLQREFAGLRVAAPAREQHNSRRTQRRV